MWRENYSLWRHLNEKKSVSCQELKADCINSVVIRGGDEERRRYTIPDWCLSRVSQKISEINPSALGTLHRALGEILHPAFGLHTLVNFCQLDSAQKRSMGKSRKYDLQRRLEWTGIVLPEEKTKWRHVFWTALRKGNNQFPYGHKNQHKQ